MNKEKKSAGLVKFTTKQKIIMALLAFTQFTVVLDFMVISPLGDALMKSLNISPAQFGFAVSCYAFSAGAAGILTASFADKFDRKKLLLFFYTGFILGTLMCGVANTYHFLLLARIITGLFGGVIGSISMAIVADVFPFEIRGRVMSTIQMGFAASQVMGIPVGLYLANMWNWHTPFIFIVVIATLTVIAIFTYLQPITEHLAHKTDKNIFQIYWGILKHPEYRVGYLTTSLVSIGSFLMQPFASTYLINNIHITMHELPFVFMATGIASLITMPLIGRLADKVDKYKLFFVGSVWGIVWLNIYTHLPPVSLPIMIVVNIMFFTGIVSRMVPATTYLSAIPKIQDRGAFMSLNASLQQIAGGVGAAVAGMIIVQKSKSEPILHYDTVGYIGTAIMIFCIYLLYRVSKIIKSRSLTELNGVFG